MNNIDRLDRSRFDLPDEARKRVVELLRSATEVHGAYVVSLRTGVSDRTLRAHLNGHYHHMSLPAADKIVTHLYGPDLWHRDPVLSAWYEA